MALVDSCDEPSDDVEWTAYRQVLKGYPELKAKEFRAEIDSLISLGHLALQGGESVSTSNEVEKQSLTPTPNGRAFAENTKKYPIDEALSGIAYGFVMLGEALRRVHILLHGHEDRSKCPKLDVATTTMPEREMVHTDQPAYTASGDTFLTRVERHVRRPDMPVEIPQPSLTEYRAYFEWSLSLGRKLSDVMSSKRSAYTTDVRSSDIVGDRNYRLAPLPRTIRDRMDQAVAHQTYWIREGGWGLAEIEEWRKETLAQFAEDLRLRQPALGSSFDEYVVQFRGEITEYG